jgi:hypothetical protein
MVIEMDGLRFLKAWSLPHFYFHVVTAYDIPRHRGVVDRQDGLPEPSRRLHPREKGLTPANT